ncbi:MAG: hypothetical protein R3C00_09400 [Hyphomonas sp.]
MKALDADETLAQLLASEGFETVEEIAYVAPEDFISIEGFDEDVAAGCRSAPANSSSASPQRTMPSARSSASRMP